jgi:hypothetical protein
MKPNHIIDYMLAREKALIAASKSNRAIEYENIILEVDKITGYTLSQSVRVLGELEKVMNGREK